MSGAHSVATYLRKAEQALAAARLLLQAKDADGACNRAYYAMFDAAHASLFSLGKEGLAKRIKTHNGLVAKFGQEVVVPGQLSSQFGSDLNKVQTLRELAD